MPTRIIRGEINSSDSLSRVSMQADLTFRALLVSVDDFGRADARPAALKAALFPIRDDVSPNAVLSWVHDLANLKDPPVILYRVEARPYLQLANWEKHRGKGRRAAQSKFPGPDQANGSTLVAAESEEPSEDILGSPATSVDIRPLDVGRLTLDVGRGGGVEGAAPPVDDKPSTSSAGGKVFDPVADQLLVKLTNQTFALYEGPQLRSISKARKKRLRTITRDYDLDVIVVVSNAIHGYVCRCGLKETDDFNPRSFFTLDSIIRPKNLDANLDAYAEAVRVGNTPPFEHNDHTKKNRKRKQQQRKAKQAKAAAAEPDPVKMTPEELRESQRTRLEELQRKISNDEKMTRFEIDEAHRLRKALRLKTSTEKVNQGGDDADEAAGQTTDQ